MTSGLFYAGLVLMSFGLFGSNPHALIIGTVCLVGATLHERLDELLNWEVELDDELS